MDVYSLFLADVYCVEIKDKRGNKTLTKPIAKVEGDPLLYSNLELLSDDCVDINILGRNYDGQSGYYDLIEDYPELFIFETSHGEKIEVGDEYSIVGVHKE